MHMVVKPVAKKSDAPAPSAPGSQIPAGGGAQAPPVNPFGGMGGFGGFPSMMAGGGPSGMGGLNLDPNAIS